MAALTEADAVGLDGILKNTEFENTQQANAIQSERERIEAHQKQCKANTQAAQTLEASLPQLREQAKRLQRQFHLNRENYERLKHTTVVLDEHEEALLRKLRADLQEAEKLSKEQATALRKYEAIWTSYKVEYGNSPKAMERAVKLQEVGNISDDNASLAKRLEELESMLKQLQLGSGKPISTWVLEIARLQVGTGENAYALQSGYAHIGVLHKELGELKVQVEEMQTLLRKQKEEQEEERRRQTKELQELESRATLNTETLGLRNTLPQSLPSKRPQLTHPLATSNMVRNVLPQANSMPANRLTVLPSVQQASAANVSRSTKPSTISAFSTSTKYRLEIPKLSTTAQSSLLSTPSSRITTTLSNPALTVYTPSTTTTSRTPPMINILTPPRPRATSSTLPLPSNCTPPMKSVPSLQTPKRPKTSLLSGRTTQLSQSTTSQLVQASQLPQPTLSMPKPSPTVLFPSPLPKSRSMQQVMQPAVALLPLRASTGERTETATSGNANLVRHNQRHPQRVELPETGINVGGGSPTRDNQSIQPPIHQQPYSSLCPGDASSGDSSSCTDHQIQTPNANPSQPTSVSSLSPMVVDNICTGEGSMATALEPQRQEPMFQIHGEGAEVSQRGPCGEYGMFDLEGELAGEGACESTGEGESLNAVQQDGSTQPSLENGFSFLGSAQTSQGSFFSGGFGSEGQAPCGGFGGGFGISGGGGGLGSGGFSLFDAGAAESMPATQENNPGGFAFSFGGGASSDQSNTTSGFSMFGF